VPGLQIRRRASSTFSVSSTLTSSAIIRARAHLRTNRLHYDFAIASPSRATCRALLRNAWTLLAGAAVIRDPLRLYSDRVTRETLISRIERLT
jgi:hypothetical protein